MIPAALGEVEIFFRSTEFAIVCKKHPRFSVAKIGESVYLKPVEPGLGRLTDSMISEGENIGRGFNNICNVKSC